MREWLITPPAGLPVTLGEFKSFLRTTSTHEDTFLQECLAIATDLVEQNLRRSIIEQTREIRLDNYPDGPFGEPWCPPWPNGSLRIDLPRPPLVSVTSVTYVALDGTTATLAPSKYQVVRSQHEKGQIVRTLPADYVAIKEVPDAVTIRYVAGYGPSSLDVPNPIRDAVRTLAAYRYETRGMVADETIVSKIVAQNAPGYRLVEFP